MAVWVYTQTHTYCMYIQWLTEHVLQHNRMSQRYSYEFSCGGVYH